MDWGLKVSRNGFDISTSDPRELVFSSEFRTLNIALTGTTQRTQNGGSHTFTIAHGLSFTPFALVFFSTSAVPGDWVFAPTNGAFDNLNGDKNQLISSDIRVDSTNLTINVSFGNGLSETITVRYYIFNLSV